jgi:CHAT domain-containing protein/tetratricopeptide (TPR) repeat protein
MEQVISPDTWTDEQLAENLLALSGSDEFGPLLPHRGEPIDLSMIQQLKDEIARLICADLHRAVRLAEVARVAAARCNDPVGLALAQHASAIALHFSGRYAEALEFYEQAEAIYARLGHEVEAARIGRAKIDALMYLGEYDQALATAANARQILQKHDQALLLAQLETNVGNIYHRLDRYQEALTFYHRAGDIFAAHHDEMGLALIRFNCANQYTCLNEFEPALKLYEEARHVYEKLNLPRLANDVQYSIAWLYFQRGKFRESLQLFATVRDRSRQLGDVALEALCDLDLAEVYLQLNAYEDAIESAHWAVDKFQRLEMNYECTKARMYLGIALTQLNDLAAAEGELQAARQGFLAEGNEVFTGLTDLYLSDLFIHQRDDDRAIELCIEAKRIFTEQGLPAKAAYAQWQLARLKLAQGEAAQAQRLCQSALELIGPMEAPWLKHRCLHLMGNIMAQTGQEAEAYRGYTQAIQHLEDLRSSIRIDEFKCTFWRDKLRVYEDLVQLCLRAGTQEKIEEALAYAEAAKSRSLVDLLATHQPIESKAPGAMADATRHEWQQIREQLDWFYNRINQYEVQAQGRPDRLVMKLREEAHKRERVLAKLVRRMRIEDTEYASLHTTSQLDIAQLRRCLAEDEVLIEYYIVNERVKIFAVSPDGVRVFNDVSTTGRTAPLLRRFKFYLDKFTLSGSYVHAHQANLQSLTDQCLKLLYTELVEPIAPLLEGKRVIFVPHDILHYVPFSALHDGREYLIDRHEISCCPSASVYKLCWEKAQKKRGDGQVLVLGVPDEMTPYIHNEVAAVQSLWPEAQVFVGEQATLERLKQTAPQCRLLHLASHGVFRRDNPMFSALKLSDAWLNFYDIFNLNLNAELVTLSACETGMNEVFPGDELFGLMRGFLYAGAPSLIVSLWMVHDRSTAELMRNLYAGLRQGLSKRAALRQAQLAVKQQYQHPYYWAPFILLGAPS